MDRVQAFKIAVVHFLVIGSLVFSGCAVLPKGSAVLAQRELLGCGSKDISAKHADRFIRITEENGKGFSHGGSDKHWHAFGHEHQGELRITEQVIQPYGTRNLAASEFHKHRYQTVNATPTLTDAEMNRFPHVRFGLYGFDCDSHCIPGGAILGYIGKQIPEGWHSLDDYQDLYIAVGLKKDWGRPFRQNPAHAHRIDHTHDIVIKQSQRIPGSTQTFTPRIKGDMPASTTHGHLAKEKLAFSGSSSETEPRLSFVRMQFIVANDRTIEAPSGAVVLYSGDDEPPGWIRADIRSIMPMNGAFLRVGKLDNRTVEHYPETHTHDIRHSHRLSTKKTEAAPASGLAAPDPSNRNTIALQNHTHTEETGDMEMTAASPAHHLPLYVSVHLLIKK